MVLKREPLGDFPDPSEDYDYGRGGGGFKIDRRDLSGGRILGSIGDVKASQRPPGTLHPRILTPPPVMLPKKKGTLEVLVEGLNKIFKAPVPVTEAETVAHIFGIPHNVGEIATGVLGGIASNALSKYPVMQAGQQALGFYEGWSPLDSSIEMFSGAYNLAKELNVAEQPGTGVSTFLGCPVEESDGCEPNKKRYTITIDQATGQCIKIKRQKSRKRRRRLASLSDIKDIAALKQVLGGGKALDTWIATRGR